MQNEFEAEKLPWPQIATRVSVYTVDQGTTNPVGTYIPWGFSIPCKRCTMPHPRWQSFFTQN